MIASDPAVASSGGLGARLGVLDVLRGVAVLLVLAQHVGELVHPALTHAVSGRAVQVGQAGVMLFFLCSGFIIPTSLERLGSLRRFWTRRVLRLYPLYWTSLVVALLLTLAGAYPRGSTLTPADWIANVTMVQGFAGRTDAVGLYWSLAWEMAFYLAMSALFVIGLHRRSTGLSIACSAGAAAVAAGAAVLGRADVVPVGTVSFVLMFLGTVWYRWFAGEIRLRALVGAVVAAVVGTGVVAFALLGAEDPTGTGALARGPMLAAWWSSIAVFGVGVVLARRGATGPRWLRHVGVISYSIYLLQGLVLGALPLEGVAPGVRALAWVVLVVALSELTFRVVERPAIRLGRRVTAARPDPVRPPSADVPA
jgi:peptidoglycan/LPS O-acetylase OafA/YrhL